VSDMIGTLHQASINHKIIMIHQSFLGKSFKDVRYTYTRWACATAAKSIIGSYTTRDPEEPQWWVEQAFVVTSGLCLLLDMFHRPYTDPEVEEYVGYLQQAVRFLQQFFTSSVATHGVRLLLSLLQEYNKMHEGIRSPTAPVRVYPPNSANRMGLPIADTVRMPHEQNLSHNPEIPLSNEEAAQFNFDLDTIAFEGVMDWLPLDGALESTVFMDNIYGLANGQYS
jgi:transcription elongation factor SPT5